MSIGFFARHVQHIRSIHWLYFRCVELVFPGRCRQMRWQCKVCGFKATTRGNLTWIQQCSGSSLVTELTNYLFHPEYQRLWKS
ncbi:hypothetical protein DPEC_G00237340 [Dallia pectoralis]|uniref:Uncharacterized protein n=1 Tax=Dallia pectoralis TaxID=75939 RepID=A0ACC2FYJ6_DALPE|nr:hypothetical protein DPEC_G00237340 [Dallia pectoralis]